MGQVPARSHLAHGGQVHPLLIAGAVGQRMTGVGQGAGAGVGQATGAAWTRCLGDPLLAWGMRTSGAGVEVAVGVGVAGLLGRVRGTTGVRLAGSGSGAGPLGGTTGVGTVLVGGMPTGIVTLRGCMMVRRWLGRRVGCRVWRRRRLRVRL